MKTIHHGKCKCSLLSILETEINTFQLFRSKQIQDCIPKHTSIVSETCTVKDMCNICKENNRYKIEASYLKLLNKYIQHDCLADWNGSARGMEGESGSKQIISIAEDSNNFVNILVKDDDGTIMARASYRE